MRGLLLFIQHRESTFSDKIIDYNIRNHPKIVLSLETESAEEGDRFMKNLVLILQDTLFKHWFVGGNAISYSHSRSSASQRPATIVAVLMGNRIEFGIEADCPHEGSRCWEYRERLRAEARAEARVAARAAARKTKSKNVKPLRARNGSLSSGKDRNWGRWL